MPFWGISQVSQWFKKKKKSPANAGDTRDAGSIPGSGRFPGVGNGNPPQYSFLENSMDTGAWWAPIHGIAKSWTQLSTCTHTHTHTHTPFWSLTFDCNWIPLKNPWTWIFLVLLYFFPQIYKLYRTVWGEGKSSAFASLFRGISFLCSFFFFFFLLWLKSLPHKLAPNIWFALWLASSSPVQSPSQGCWPLTQWGILPPRSWCPPFCEGRMSHVFKSISLVPSSLRMCTRGSRQDDPHLFVGTALLRCLVIESQAVVLPLGSLPVISLLFLLIPREGESCSLLCIGWHLPTTLWLYKDTEHCEWGVGKEGWVWDLIQSSCGLAPPELIFSPIYAGLLICQASVGA